MAQPVVELKKAAYAFFRFASLLLHRRKRKNNSIRVGNDRVKDGRMHFLVNMMLFRQLEIAWFVECRM